jgi:hypothetical protein
MSTEMMRLAAANADVSWSYQAIQYKADGIGYKNNSATDATTIKDEFEKMFGYRPVEIDEPPEPAPLNQ